MGVWGPRLADSRDPPLLGWCRGAPAQKPLFCLERPLQTPEAPGRPLRLTGSWKAGCGPLQAPGISERLTGSWLACWDPPHRLADLLRTLLDPLKPMWNAFPPYPGQQAGPRPSVFAGLGRPDP